MTDQFDDFEEELREPPRQVDAEALLREVIDIVALAKPMPLSASVLISRDEVLGRLDEIAERLPEELRQARWLLREREEFMAEQRRDADRLMEDVKAQAERMVSRTELVRQANTTAERIIEEAEESARRMRHEAEDYCDQKLAGMEIVLNRVLKTVSAGRERLQPQLEETLDEQLEEETDEGSDAFFDQDQF
jgi:cell division septum initiation protein DivIVA